MWCVLQAQLVLPMLCEEALLALALGKYSVACVPPPYCLALLTSDFPGFPFPHIGLV